MTGQNKKFYSLASIANLIGATLVGDPDFVIVGLCSLPKASPDRLSFLSNSAYKHYLKSTSAGAVILTNDDQFLFSGNKLVTEKPYLAYALASGLFVNSSKVSNSVHSSASIHSSASLAEDICIGPNVVIEEKNVSNGTGRLRINAINNDFNGNINDMYLYGMLKHLIKYLSLMIIKVLLMI